MQSTKNYNHFFDVCITTLCCYVLLVDSINGYTLHHNISVLFSVSQVYKMGILTMMCLRIAAFNIAHINAIAVFFLILILPSFNSFSLNDIGSLYSDFSITLKIVFVVVSYYYFSSLIRSKPNFTLKKIKNIVYYNAFILALNLFVGTLGFGFSQYVGGTGTRGFFYAGNEISSVLIILFSFILYNTYDQNRRYFYVFALITLGLGLLKATKVAIAGCLILIIVIPLIHGKFEPLKLTKRKILGFGFVLIFTPVVLYLTIYGIQYSGLWERFSYFYNKHDFLTFLLSRRNEFLEVGFKVFMDEYSVFEKLFGANASGFANALMPYGTSKNSVEIDYFDLLFYYGIVGSTIILLFYFLFIINSRLNISNPFAKWVLFMNLLILAISFTSGHIMFSGLAGVFIGMINALTFYREKA